MEWGSAKRARGGIISSIRSIDMRLIDDLVDFVRGPGFVLDFSDTSFAEFFASELKVDIDNPKYAVNGGSKGKRLRYFLQSCDDPTAVRTLAALWEHRSEHLARSGAEDPVANAEARYQALITRLSGGAAPPATSTLSPAPNAQALAAIKAELLKVSALAPQARGFAFEGFLKRLSQGGRAPAARQCAQGHDLLANTGAGPQPVGHGRHHAVAPPLRRADQRTRWIRACSAATS